LDLLEPGGSEIPDHLDIRLLMTADGRGHEALLRHAAQRGFFVGCGGVVLTVVDRGSPGK
jgi:hypothetical protein